MILAMPILLLIRSQQRTATSIKPTQTGKHICIQNTANLSNPLSETMIYHCHTLSKPIRLPRSSLTPVHFRFPVVGGQGTFVQSTNGGNVAVNSYQMGL